jgi:hypothetical protein
MNDYQLFGGVLRSAVDFPTLRRAVGMEPTWTLERVAAAPQPADLEPLGMDEVDTAATVRLYRGGAAWHLVYDDTGCFAVSADGRRITWYAPDDAVVEAARLDVTGRVLPMALHAAGEVCLHASAVSVDGRVIAFLGAKGYGKSTLAWALVRAGARLVTDDTLRIRPGDPVLAYPGLHEIRLRRDTAAQLPPPSGAARSFGERIVVHEWGDHHLESRALRLDTLYVLVPTHDTFTSSADAGDAIPAVQAALSLVRHAKIAPLLTGLESVQLLDRIVHLADRVPVRVLRVPRAFSQLGGVVDALLEPRRRRVGVPAA